MRRLREKHNAKPESLSSKSPAEQTKRVTSGVRLRLPSTEIQYLCVFFFSQDCNDCLLWENVGKCQSDETYQIEREAEVQFNMNVILKNYALDCFN